jgi:hypothetical protein
MALEVKDYAHFCCFNLDTLRAMRNLKELELFCTEGTTYSWAMGEAGLEIFADLTGEVREWPEWRVPEITIFWQHGKVQESMHIRGREDLMLEEEDELEKDDNDAGATGGSAGATFGYL